MLKRRKPNHFLSSSRKLKVIQHNYATNLATVTSTSIKNVEINYFFNINLWIGSLELPYCQRKISLPILGCSINKKGLNSQSLYGENCKVFQSS